MILTSNAEDVAKSILEAREKIKKKLELMVWNFAALVTEAASENTPVVSEENLLGKFKKLYELRYEKRGIEMSPGFHAGSWRYSEGNLVFDPTIYAAPEEPRERAYQAAKAQYKLGDTFMIASVGTAIQKLENRMSPQAPMGIMQPTLETIMSTFGLNLVALYQKGR